MHNDNVDYTKLIDDAVSKGNFSAAAQYEQARNEKIDDNGLNYAKTSKYTQYLPENEGSTNDGSTGASYSYSGKSDQPTYTNNQQSQIDSLSSAILGRDAFSYDPGTDQLYKSYQDQYTRKGQTAMQDTLGQISARTGGMASSYAGTAAQQTYDNYMQELSDKIPELQQAAYEKYQDQGNDMRNNLSMLQSLEGTDYNRYLDDLSQYNTDRSFDYGVQRDAVSDDQWNQNFDYGKQRDTVSDSQWGQTFDYQKGRDTVSDSQWQKDFDYKAQQDSLNRSASSAKGSKSSAAPNVDDLFGAMYASGDPYTYLVLNGYTTAEAKGIVDSSGYHTYDTDMRHSNMKTESDSNSYMVEGMGKMSESDIEKMLDSGKIYVTAVDENNNPIAFAITPETKKGMGNNPISLTK